MIENIYFWATCKGLAVLDWHCNVSLDQKATSQSFNKMFSPLWPVDRGTISQWCAQQYHFGWPERKDAKTCQTCLATCNHHTQGQFLFHFIFSSLEEAVVFSLPYIFPLFLHTYTLAPWTPLILSASKLSRFPEQQVNLCSCLTFSMCRLGLNLVWWKPLRQQSLWNLTQEDILAWGTNWGFELMPCIYLVNYCASEQDMLSTVPRQTSEVPSSDLFQSFNCFCWRELGNVNLSNCHGFVIRRRIVSFVLVCAV